MINSMNSLAMLRNNRRTGRVSSWDQSGRNSDWWNLAPGETKVLADIRGPGQITHIWFAQPKHFREVLLRITWDDAAQPSILCPVGDFFGLGNGFTNSYQSALFSASTSQNNEMTYDPTSGQSRTAGTALNCYAPMPFRKSAKIELINESDEPHPKWFYIDYETFTDGWDEQLGYFHAEFRRANPFGGWGADLTINSAMVDAPVKERFAWDNNYVLTETTGRGQYIGCNISVANLCGGWWGEGDDMIWVDGYHWPPDLHGTGSEDYLNQAWGMQPNAFWRNGSSLFEGHTNGYQSSYVFHLENPIYFQKTLKATIEIGHGNHLANDISSVAYWYAAKPTAVVPVPPVACRRPVFRDANGVWQIDPANQWPGPRVTLTKEILAAAPIVADALRPVENVTWTIPTLSDKLALGEIARALTKTDPLCAGSLAEFRVGRSGDRLALSIRINDPDARRVDESFWEGSSIEIFGAADERSQPGQVVILPPLGRQAGEVRVYRQAHWIADAPTILWRSRKVSGGYQFVALVPLACLNVKPTATTFRFEAAVNVPQPTGPVQRAGLLSMVGDGYRSARRFGNIKSNRRKS